MDKKIVVGNLNISCLTKDQFLSEVTTLLNSDAKTFIITPNSEFLYSALRNNSLRDLFNSANISLADGIAIFWAERFLAIPFRLKSLLGRFIEACLQVVISGARILFTPSYLYKNIPEKITGADVFWDLVEVASQNHNSIFLVNDWGKSAELTAKLLQRKFIDLKIAGVSKKSFDDLSLVADIKQAQPDFLFLAYGQPKQEQWIKAHLSELPVRIAIGIGGTFDYAAGVKRQPPAFIRSIGLEWLFRLITQPRRLPRIYRATVGLIIELVKFKLNTKLEKTS